MTKKQDQNHGFITLVKADAMRWNESLNALNFIGMLLLQHGFQLAFLIRTQQAVSKLPAQNSMVFHNYPHKLPLQSARDLWQGTVLPAPNRHRHW
jgi:hypothetical protein